MLKKQNVTKFLLVCFNEEIRINKKSEGKYILKNRRKCKILFTKKSNEVCNIITEMKGILTINKDAHKSILKAVT